jgi:hypothetical protein
MRHRVVLWRDKIGSTSITLFQHLTITQVLPSLKTLSKTGQNQQNMRIIGEVEHPRLKISIFRNDGRFSIKFESGLLEQIYKLRDDERITTADDVKRLVDAEFIEKVENILRGMQAAKSESLLRHYPPPQEEEFDKIL